MNTDDDRDNATREIAHAGVRVPVTIDAWLALGEASRALSIWESTGNEQPLREALAALRSVDWSWMPPTSWGRQALEAFFTRH